MYIIIFFISAYIVWMRNISTWAAAGFASCEFCGLVISVPTASAVDLYSASQHATQVIVGAVKQVYSLQITVHDDKVFAARTIYQQLMKHTQWFVFYYFI